MTTFEASRRSPLPHAEILGPADPAETTLVTLFLRRRSPLPEPGTVVLTREELRERYGADPAEADAVRAEVERLGLRVVLADAGSRRVQVEGTVGRLSEIFGVELQQARHAEGETFRYRTGELTLPEALREATVGVLGLDTRPQATPRFKRHKKQAASASYTPLQVGSAYQFPAGYDGAGQGIALIELGGGYTDSNNQQYFQSIGVTPPQITAVPVDGGSNAPTGSADGPDGEVQLDVQVAGALAPGASISVYFAPNTDQGFADAVTDAAHATSTPTAISISWGGPEDSWAAQSVQALDAACADAVALGVTVLTAAGDTGSADSGAAGTSTATSPPPARTRWPAAARTSRSTAAAQSRRRPCGTTRTARRPAAA